MSATQIIPSADSTQQLSLFDPTDYNTDLPLPLLVARQWQFALRTAKDDSLFCLRDWVTGVTGSSNVAQLLKNYRRRGVFSKNPYKADGLEYLTDRELYRVTQDIRATKSRPAVAAIKDYLSKAGAFADEVRRNPETAIRAGIEGYQRRGLPTDWIADRFSGIGDRKGFTDAMQQTIINLIPSKHYAEATNLVSRGLWKRDVKTLKTQLGLKKSQSLRDFQTRQALHYTGLVEATIAHFLKEEQAVTWDQATAIITAVASAIGVQAEQLGALMGVDIATGKPLLTGGGGVK